MIGSCNSKAMSSSINVKKTAVIHIIAPVGYDVTVLKNDIAIKRFKSMQGHVTENNPNYAEFFYSVPERNFGTFSFLCNGYTVSMLVDEKRKYVILVGARYILINGIIDSEVQWSNGTGSYKTSDTFTNGAINAVVNQNYAGGSVFAPSFDLSPYSALIFHIKQTAIIYNDNAYCVRVGLKNSSEMVGQTTTNRNNFSYYTDYATVSNDFNYVTVDISSATTGLFISAVGNYAGVIDEIYLIP